MSRSNQPTSTAVPAAARESRPPTFRRRLQATAIVVGGVVGVLAGLAREPFARVPSMRSESLAAVPLPFATSTGQDRVLSSTRRASANAGELPLQPMLGRSADDTPASPCREGMRLVEGNYCPNLVHRCVDPYSDGSGRCRQFAPAPQCLAPNLKLRYCMDEYEYPNTRGVKPQVMVTFDDAKAACASHGKRLCSAREWTLACEGPDRLPYPYGHRREPNVCNVDQPHRFPDAAALNEVGSRDRELERLDQRSPSGALPRCVSAFGLFDLVGNVDEWVVPDGPEPAAGFGALTALKGGYFGPVRARCRPSTPSHGPTFKFYQVGFRCCVDASRETETQVGELAGRAAAAIDAP